MAVITDDMDPTAARNSGGLAHMHITLEGADVFDERDSALGHDANLDETDSLTSLVLNYVYEHGRRYHGYRAGRYMLPNDEEEQDRLDFQHYIFDLMLNGNLFRAPISSNPHRVLDMGTGTGIWSIAFADLFPGAYVLGVDLSPIQPQWVPPNCDFLVDDLEDDWLLDHQELFDFIHGRALGGSIKNWRRLCRQAIDHLKPGGWLEFQEYEWGIFLDDEMQVQKAPFLNLWQSTLDHATKMIGQKLSVAFEQKYILAEAGFVDIHDDIYRIPCGNRSRNPEQKHISSCQLMHMLDSIEPYSLAIFTRVLGWSLEETWVLIAYVKREIKEMQTDMYLRVHFVYGKKPAMKGESG